MCWPLFTLPNKICKNNLLAKWKNFTNSLLILHSKTNNLL